MLKFKPTKEFLKLYPSYKDYGKVKSTKSNHKRKTSGRKKMRVKKSRRRSKN